MSQRICARSVQGANHSRTGICCQDRFTWENISDSMVVMSLADGHGTCPFSDNGAEIAVDVFCYVMSQECSCAENNESFITYLNREGQLNIAKSIQKEWQHRVIQFHTKTKREDQVGKLKDTAIYKLYGTTLLGILKAETFIFAFQIGDGDILYIDKKGLSPVIDADKLLGVETHSLSDPNAWRKALSTVRRNPTDQIPYLYWMSTDGFANSYPTSDAFEKACKDYFSMIQEHGLETVSENLDKWLKETSAYGCGDDTTVFINYNTPEDI